MTFKTKKKVLIVDDEPDLVEAVRASLVESGYAVVTAANGTEGLKKAGEHKPHLILLDILMPKMDGYELLEKIKKTAELWNIPVVMVTARAETGSILKSQDLMASDYLIKPFNADELLNLVKRYI